MQNPFWVASARGGVQGLLVLGNHACVLSKKEGRTVPIHACSRDTRHFNPLTRPVTAKSASSQGEALALEGRDHKPIEFQFKIMKMEFSS